MKYADIVRTAAQNRRQRAELSLPDCKNRAKINTDGGPGSGNFGHTGRPGSVGGSGGGITGLPIHDRQGVKSGAMAEKDHVLKGCKPSTQAAYDKARANEKKITPVMQHIAQKLGAEMSGLEFSVKTASSVANKIQRKAKDGKGEEDAINEMGDLVRYTQLGTHSKLVQNAVKTKRMLEDFGYKIEEVDNKWLQKDAPYKGIHMKVRSPEGQVFELQFHSPKSLSVKNKNHIMYEEARNVNTPASRKDYLNTQMKRNTAQMPEPKDVETLQNYKV